jgi:2-polyprenyl-6-hydroxyphenyl methylase/3-demethylubiquinone-9 3-methyltransferase
MLSLNEFDIVYSWGVLHHTGDLWKALENASKAVSPDGKLIISIYNDQGWLSKYWRNIKLIYIQASFLRPFLIMLHAPYLVVMRYLVRAITGRVKLERGMSYWHDMLDWLGGYPFEVAKPEEVIYFVHKHGFSLRKLKTCGGRSGCNEFVFERTA